MNAPLRAVIADDSALYRAVLVRALSTVGGVEIVAQASNGAEAVECVKKFGPDVLTLDLNMPVLDGLGALRAIREARLDCEVIVVSSETKKGASTTIDALQLGAVDFITKPAEDNAQVSLEVLGSELKRRLAAVKLRREYRQRAIAERGSSRTMVVATAAPGLSSLSKGGDTHPPEVIAIGVSTGGPSALPVLLGALPADLCVPILIVQHMPPLFTTSLAESLDRKCALRVKEGHNGQLVLPAHVYIAPGGRHLKVKRGFDKSVRLLVTDEAPENHCRPSVDAFVSIRRRGVRRSRYCRNPDRNGV